MTLSLSPTYGFEDLLLLGFFFVVVVVVVVVPFLAVQLARS